MNYLTNDFYNTPETAHIVLPKEKVEKTLLATRGYITAKNEIWHIKVERARSGLYKVYLERKE